MDPIFIYFYALATLIGMEDTRIISQKTNLTINPVAKTFEIQQENLFAILLTAEDSIAVTNELKQILNFNKSNSNSDSLIIDEIILNKHNQELHAIIRGRYDDPEVLAGAGIYFDSSTDEFYMINIPDSNISSADAVLEGNYWVWPASKSISLKMTPFENVPVEYQSYQRSMLSFWEQALNSGR